MAAAVQADVGAEVDGGAKPLPASKKRKQPSVNLTSPSVIASTTIRKLPFSYLHLSLVSSNPSAKDPPIDALSVRSHLTAALNQFLGETGTAIPIDILKVEERDVWIRVQNADADALVGAISGWVGAGGAAAWRVKQKGDWLGAVVRGNGRDLFNG